MRRTLALNPRQGLGDRLGIAVADGIDAAIAALGLVLCTCASCLPMRVRCTSTPGSSPDGLGVAAMRAGREAAAGGGAARDRLAGGLRGRGGAHAGQPADDHHLRRHLHRAGPTSGLYHAIAAWTVGGAFGASALWRCGIVAAVMLFRHALGSRARRRIDLAAGLVLAVFGLLELRQGL